MRSWAEFRFDQFLVQLKLGATGCLDISPYNILNPMMWVMGSISQECCWLNKHLLYLLNGRRSVSLFRVDWHWPSLLVPIDTWNGTGIWWGVGDGVRVV